MRARDVVGSSLAPFNKEMPSVCTLAVPRLALDAQAVLRTAVFGDSPLHHDDLSQPLPADAREQGTLALWTGFHDDVAHRFAIDADVLRRNVEARELQAEDGVRRQALHSDARR